MSDELIVHRMVDAFFTHCHDCDEPRDPNCHTRAHWRLYLDLDPETVGRIRHWLLDPANPTGTVADRAVLLNWLDTQEA
ncbi:MULTISPECIES: hypothetical protein [unclassified Kitasatospora]|uniref:hypothetical protein n=1 Tax=unclassified Kitasatospora TaxID=2633591 RepID=UPI003324D242